MKVEEKLKRYIEMKYKTSKDFCLKSGIPTSTLSTIFKRGILNTTTDKLIAICDTLGISADELVKGNIVQKKNDSNSSQFLDRYNSLSEHSKGLIDVIIDYELNESKDTTNSNVLIAASGGENASQEEIDEAIELAKKLRRTIGSGSE